MDKQVDFSKELAYVMEAGKPQVCKVSRWCGRARKSQYFNFDLKAVRHEEPVLQMKFKGSWLQNSLLLNEGLVFLFCVGLQEIGRHPPHYGDLFALLESTDFNVNLSQKHPHRNSQNNV